MPEIHVPDISEIPSIADLGELRKTKGFPSPETWRDQILYFLLPDRFSNGKEDHVPLFDPNNPQQFKTQDKRSWMESGKIFQGGKIEGIRSKLTYLKGLGVTTLWIGPLFKQRTDLQTYHGYGIQNFFDVDPRFGTREELIKLVEEAHELGIYVILDIIYNHTGNNWFYDENSLKSDIPYRYQPPEEIAAWRSENGHPTDNINSMGDGVWPKDFQKEEWYTRAGRIGKWDSEPWENPMHKDNEFRRGDFFDLKDLNYDNNQVLDAVIRVYQYWIGLTDCDGFRIDTVKHIPWDVSRKFCGAIHEYAESIGKENFLLLGEVTGGAEMEKNYLDIFGRNIDAALDIGDPSRRIEGLAKGLMAPAFFFEQFTSSDILGGHRETGRYHVSILDDHDKVGNTKQRFSANNNIPRRFEQVAHAVGIQLTTLGIPCIYYGTEQAFDGNRNMHDANIEQPDQFGNIPFEDRYIRECMFGAEFGAFETSGCHFFNTDHPTYLRISAIAAIRNRNDSIGLALRRGRQYLRETSYLGRPFSYPVQGELIGWSRVLVDNEVLVVFNTNGTESRGAEITIHSPFHKEGSEMKVLYNGDWSDSKLKNIFNSSFETVPVKKYGDGRTTVYLELPPAGMAILA
ncbi:MAG: alpha-amylase family glycosyl hydrolase [Bacillota bacterium]